MKLKIQNQYTFYFPDAIDTDERKLLMEEFLQKTITFDEREFTVEGYFRETWDKQNTRVCMDMIGTYLSKEPNQNGKHDKEVLSNRQEKEMVTGHYKGQQRYSNMSSLSKEDKYYLGVDETNS